VHIVPHTHDDAGWLKTVDQYYAGLNNSIQHAFVSNVLDTVVKCLEENPDRKFMYVEQAFFQRWWRQQTPAKREITRKLVANGQLAMVNGGWVMHCEATPHYLDMIDQTRLGHKFLMEEFGLLPKVGWQIDPFGHSATQAALLSAETGFMGLFFGRIDYQDLQLRVQQSKAEFVWRASPSLGRDVQVFSGLTGEYGGNYGPPGGFCFDQSCQDELIQDDPGLDDYNVQSRVDDFVKAARWQSSHTRGNNIMMTMGSDFQYENAAEWYRELDKLIHYVNKDGRVNAFYSNPDVYVAAKAKEGLSWPLKTDDFFPYADGAHQFWTGYFTSRPALKRYVREVSGFFQIAKQLLALGLPEHDLKDVETLAEAIGVAQHHDAVSGTAKQHTTFDYAMRLSRGQTKAEVNVSKALAALSSATKAEFSFCSERNVSVCAATQEITKDSSGVSILVWNGLAQRRLELMEVPVSSNLIKIIDSDGVVVASQVVESLPSLTNYGKPAGGAPWTLLFNAELPALGFKTYRLQPAPQAKAIAISRATEVNEEDITLQNDVISVTFCAITGRMCRITNKKAGISTKVDQDWFWYLGSVGNEKSGQTSGAYIFRPNKTKADRVFSGKPLVKVVDGPLVMEVHQNFGNILEQRVRLSKGMEPSVEVTYTILDLPIKDGWGKELVSRMTTDIKNDGQCYTDSNGREMLQRQRNFRPSWKLNQTEPVAGNYYPVGTAIAIRDNRAQLTVLTDAVQAGTGCIANGELEMMVDRRLLKDDGRGVGEPLNETEKVTPYYGDGPQGQHYGAPLVIRGRHFVILGAPETTAAHCWRHLQDRVYIPAMPFFTQDHHVASVPAASFLNHPLPFNVQIVTLEPVRAHVVLLRLAHQFGKGEDVSASKPAKVNLETLFKGKSIANIKEMSLTGTAPRKVVIARRIPWKVDGEDPMSMPNITHQQFDWSSIELGPLQIRTFEITFATTIFV